MSVEWVAGSPWNQWPDVHGIGGRMAVESAVDMHRAGGGAREGATLQGLLSLRGEPLLGHPRVE